MVAASVDSTELLALRAALLALEARGARAFDGPACECVEALLARAEELGGGLAQRLSQRAEAHLSSLRARFEAENARVAARLDAFEAERGEHAELRKALVSGDLVRVARRMRRLRAAPPVAARTLALKDPRGTGFARAGVHALRRKRTTTYEDSVAQMVATLAMARATDVVPEDAGPYNPLRIASDVLERMRTISPFYLAVQLNRLEELASLLSLPELPESEHPKGRLLAQAEAEKKHKKARPKR
jgi:Protein of unknown function (DUF2894)